MREGEKRVYIYIYIYTHTTPFDEVLSFFWTLLNLSSKNTLR